MPEAHLVDPSGETRPLGVLCSKPLPGQSEVKCVDPSDATLSSLKVAERRSACQIEDQPTIANGHAVGRPAGELQISQTTLRLDFSFERNFVVQRKAQ